MLLNFLKRIFGITPKKETAVAEDIKKGKIKKEVEVKTQKDTGEKETK